MENLFPFQNFSGIFSWLASLCLLNFLPGYVLGGRYLDMQDRLTRLAVCFGLGMLLFPLAGNLMSAIKIPLTPPFYLLVCLASAYLLGRSTRYRLFWQDLGASLPPLGHLTQFSAIAGSLVMAGIIQQAFSGYAAPPHLVDASNHSFLVSRIVELHSMKHDLVFGLPWGPPAKDYLIGWHVAAALVAQLSGIRPYASAWYITSFCAAILPIMLTIIWRVFRLQKEIMALAIWFVVANYYTPNNIFSWGGDGQIIGLSILPFTLVLIRLILIKPSFPNSIIAGLAMVALVYIHTAEVFLVVVLLFPAWPKQASAFSIKARLKGAFFFVGTFILIGLLPLLPTFIQYFHVTSGRILDTSPGWTRTLSEFRIYGGGNVPVLQRLVFPGMLIGLLMARTRKVAILSALLGILFCGLRQTHDPVSLFLGQPFYQSTARSIYPQIYLLQPLIAALFISALEALKWLLNKWSQPSIWLFRAAVFGLLLFTTVHYIQPGIYWNYRNLENKHHVVPFSHDDALLAARMAHELPQNTKVANQDQDGSIWAMHISGMNFLDPCSWSLGAKQGRCLRGAIAHLLDRPWPKQTLALKKIGTSYLFVSDTALANGRHPLTRSRVEADLRFRKVMQGKDSSVYEILWSQTE